LQRGSTAFAKKEYTIARRQGGLFFCAIRECDENVTISAFEPSFRSAQSPGCLKPMNQPSLLCRATATGLVAAALSVIVTTSPLLAGTPVAPVSEPPSESKSESWFEEWWNGKYMTGNWFGLRETLADYGFKFSGKYEGIFFGVVDSQRGSRGFYDQELAFAGDLDFGKLLRVEALEGLSGFGEVRWRDSRANSNPNTFVLANSLFQPSNNQSGTQWRLLTFGLEYETPELFGIKEFLTLRGGWLRPQKEFIDQPLSKLFINNAIESAKGLGGNIQFSSSFSTWGSTLQVKPIDWYYLKVGLFMAYPQATDSRNHGLAFEGFREDTSQNGLFFMGETGVTPKIGPSQLPGKYVFGGFYYGGFKNSFNGTPNYGQWGLYWQFDQMLFREPSPEEPAPLSKGLSDAKSTVPDGKSFEEPVAPSKPKLSKQGLYSFNLISFAPAYNNLFPFYFQSGLVYEGLIPTRDKDKLMFAIAYGDYSNFNIDNLQQQGNVNQPNYSIVLEWDYRIQINEWAYFQPFIQYIIKPNGTEAVKNATILGFAYALTF
jgi:porin